MERTLGAALCPFLRPLFVRLAPVLRSRRLRTVELVDHEHGRVVGRRAVDELRRVDLQATGHSPPPPLAAVAAGNVLLDEAVLLELAEVVARRSARLAERGGELRGGRRTLHAEAVTELHPQGVGEPAQRSGVDLTARRSVGRRRRPRGRTPRRSCSLMRPLDERLGPPAQLVGPPVQPLGPRLAAERHQLATPLTLAQELGMALVRKWSREGSCAWGSTLQMQRFLCKLLFADSSLQLFLCIRHTRRPRSRAMSRRCTSLVPSPISRILASR